MRVPVSFPWFRKPIVLATLASAALVAALTLALHGLLEWEVQTSLLRNAEIKAQNWSERFFRTVPDAEQMFTDAAAGRTDVMQLAGSFAMVDILRFELFDHKGQRTFLSDQSELEPEAPANPKALEVYRTGTPKFFVYHQENSEQEGIPDTFVETYVPAVSPNGERVGTMEIYVDVSSLEKALEDAFQQISWFLIAGTTVILAVPAAAYVRRTRQLRSRDQRLLELTRYDQLTGILNRNSISDILETTFASPGPPASLGILFVDVDYFKQVNDQYGHACGDRLLKHVADILKSSTRGSSDIVGRFGGDEFVVLCRDIDKQEFRKLCGRVTEGAKTPCEYEGKSYTPSLSVGAYLARAGDTQKCAMHRADLAVYAAKHRGRGQVMEYSKDLEGLFQAERRSQDCIDPAKSGD